MRKFIVGSSKKHSDILCEDSSIEKNHARLMVSSEGGAVIADTGSSKGTFLNGERLTANKYILLKEGDSIKFGKYPYTFVFGKGISSRTRSRSASVEVETKAKVKSSEKLFSAFKGDEKSKEKFMKLMGVKGSESKGKSNGNDSINKKEVKEMQKSLERHFSASLKRKVGQGLGF